MIDDFLNEVLSLLRSINHNLELIAGQTSSPLQAQSSKDEWVQNDMHDLDEVVPPVESSTPETPEPEAPTQVPVSQDTQAPGTKSYAESFEELKALVESNAWPQAVDPDLICHDESEEDKELRAEGIIDFMIDESLEGKKFLDFGCGDGHVVKKALEKKPVLSMGYDIKQYDNWTSLGLPDGEKHAVTTDWSKVTAEGPYDVVLIYDVLDHMDGQQASALKKLRTVMNPGGRLYIRCHPWCSRHATHLYKTMNKAFLHLIFSEVELARLGLSNGLKTEKIIHPHLIYKQWFNDAGLDLVNENAIQENLEDFFHINPILNERIKDNWRGNSIDPQLAAGKGFPGYQLRIQFVDYILKNNS